MHYDVEDMKILEIERSLAECYNAHTAPQCVGGTQKSIDRVQLECALT